MPASTVNLRELQAPIKARYLEHPAEALIESSRGAPAPTSGTHSTAR